MLLQSRRSCESVTFSREGQLRRRWIGFREALCLRGYMKRSRESGSSSNSSGQRSPQLAYVCLKCDNCHGALDCNDFHLQPVSRFPSLLDLARIFLPVTHFVLLNAGQEEQTSVVQRDLGGCLLVAVLQDESAQPLFEFLPFGGLVWEAGSRRSLGFRPVASSKGVLPLKVTCVFLTVAALRINWAGVICARVVWSRFWDVVSTSAKEKFLEQSYTHLCSVLPWCRWSCRNSLYVVQSVECLHVVRMVESHICTSRRRVHLERVHPLMNLNSYFRCRGTFAWMGC